MSRQITSPLFRGYRVIRAIVIIAFIYGIVVTFVFQNCDRWILKNADHAQYELPLGGINGIALDSKNQIYIGSSDYQRIQVYSSEGNFIRALIMRHNTGGAKFIFRIKSDDVLEVYGFAGGITCLFKDGRLYERHAGTAIPPFGTDNVFQEHNESGVSVSIAPFSWCVPRVMRTAKSGQTEMLWLQPLYLWIIKSPFPAFAIPFFFIFLFWLITGYLKFKRRKTLTNN